MKSAQKTQKRRWQPCPNNLLYFSFLSLSFPINHTFLFSLSLLAPRERKTEGDLICCKSFGSRERRIRGRSSISREKERGGNIHYHPPALDGYAWSSLLRFFLLFVLYIKLILLVSVRSFFMSKNVLYPY